MKQTLSAFPLTPLKNDDIDLASFSKLLRRLVDAKVDSISILGSTGCYPYLDRSSKQKAIQAAVEQSNGIPIMVGIGSLTTKDVLNNAKDAQKLGASSIMLAPVSYHKLTDDDVFTLFKTVAHEVSLPICLYDNPSTTNFKFSDDLYARIAQLPNIDSLKIPGIAQDLEISKQRINTLRSLLPKHIKIGVSADSSAAWGILAGADIWYSATAGLLPTIIQKIFHAAQKGDIKVAEQLTNDMQPLWSLVVQYQGSVRCIAAMAEILRLVQSPCLPDPIRPINAEAIDKLKAFLKDQAII